MWWKNNTLIRANKKQSFKMIGALNNNIYCSPRNNLCYCCLVIVIPENSRLQIFYCIPLKAGEAIRRWLDYILVFKLFFPTWYQYDDFKLSFHYVAIENNANKKTSIFSSIQIKVFIDCFVLLIQIIFFSFYYPKAKIVIFVYYITCR